MKQVVIWGTLGLLCVGGVVWQYANAPQAAAESATPQPPLSPEWSPQELIALASAAHRKPEAQTTLSELIGCRIAEGGWSGQAVTVTDKVVILEQSGGIGGITIHVTFREVPTIEPGTSFAYRGRLASVTSRAIGPNIVNRVEIDDAEIVR